MLIEYDHVFQPVGFVTFSSRVAAEAAKQDLQVYTNPCKTNGLFHMDIPRPDSGPNDGPFPIQK